MALEPEDKVSTEDVRVFSTTSMGEASIVGSPVDMVQQRIVTVIFKTNFTFKKYYSAQFGSPSLHSAQFLARSVDERM